MKRNGLLARTFGRRDDNHEEVDEMGFPPTSSPDSLAGVEFHQFNFFIGIDWRRVGPTDPVRWRLVLYSQMGDTHPVFDMVSSYVAGPEKVRYTHWSIPIDTICLPSSSGKQLHEDMMARAMAFRDGVLYIRCGGHADHYHVVDIMRNTFKLGIFKIVTPEVFSIDLRQLAWKDNLVQQEVQQEGLIASAV